jgi:hypothetical protein
LQKGHSAAEPFGPAAPEFARNRIADYERPEMIGDDFSPDPE